MTDRKHGVAMPTWQQPTTPPDGRNKPTTAPTTGGHGGSEPGWAATAKAVERAAAALAQAVATLPPGEPKPGPAKKLRSAIGRINHDTGTLKRTLGIGTHKN